MRRGRFPLRPPCAARRSPSDAARRSQANPAPLDHELGFLRWRATPTRDLIRSSWNFTRNNSIPAGFRENSRVPNRALSDSHALSAACGFGKQTIPLVHSRMDSTKDLVNDVRSVVRAVPLPSSNLIDAHQIQFY